MDELFVARIKDLFEYAERGVFSYSDFFNESEVAFAKKTLSGINSDCKSIFWGGYENSERKRLFVYPEYYQVDDFKDCIKAVEIKGSGYENLKHSSFLGALTALGIDRSKMGDIVLSGNSAILFADEKIVEFLLSFPPPLTRVGRDTVKICEYLPPSDFSAKKEYKDIFDTVSSLRLDAVTASLANVSREKAKSIVISGTVQLNYLPEQRPDVEIGEDDIVTIRGVGKFRIISVSEKTKKDRYKLIAKKYI